MDVVVLGEGTLSDLSHNYRQQIERFVEGVASFDDLYDWVCAFAADLAMSPDPFVRRLDDQFWALVGEQGRGDRSVESIREELRSMLSPAIPFASLRAPGSGSVVIRVQSRSPDVTVSSANVPNRSA